MPYDHRDPWKLWCGAPWYEQAGMIVFLSIHAAPFLIGLLQVLGFVH